MVAHVAPPLKTVAAYLLVYEAVEAGYLGRRTNGFLETANDAADGLVWRDPCRSGDSSRDSAASERRAADVNWAEPIDHGVDCRARHGGAVSGGESDAFRTEVERWNRDYARDAWDDCARCTGKDARGALHQPFRQHEWPPNGTRIPVGNGGRSRDSHHAHLERRACEDCNSDAVALPSLAFAGGPKAGRNPDVEGGRATSQPRVGHCTSLLPGGSFATIRCGQTECTSRRPRLLSSVNFKPLASILTESTIPKSISGVSPQCAPSPNPQSRFSPPALCCSDRKS